MSQVLLDLRSAARARTFPLDVPPQLVRAARATWLGRMVNEHESSHVFEAVADQLAEAGFSMNDVEACRAFAEEERRHGVLCGAVVESLGGEARAQVPERTLVPRHEEVGRLEAVLRNLLSVSCLSETVAVALIGAERIEMPQGLLRDLLTRIWADEVGHARFGWRVLREQVPCLGHAARARMDAYLVVALTHLERHELSHLPVYTRPRGDEQARAALGLCDGGDARLLFFETVAGVIVPQLEALGLHAARAWEIAQNHASRAA